MDEAKPTIKGMFVNSHIAAVRAKKGADGVAELERRYGKPVVFKNSDDVPIREEVQIIECALDLLADQPIAQEEKAFEAGKLHFRNFTQTPLGKILFSLFQSNFKLMMLHARDIAGHVFQGVRFSTQEIDEKSIKVILENNDYPLDHFRGLFSEWMTFAGLTGTVSAQNIDGRYEYTMQWQ